MNTQENQTGKAGEVEAYPLHWPPGRGRTASGRRQRADFGRVKTETRSWGNGQSSTFARRERLTIGQARDRLRDELRRLNASKVVVSTNLRLRLDGDVYANQKEPEDPGVAVYFHRDGKALAIAIDLWDRVADNLAAVAKSIEAIRGLDRWGGGQMVSAAFTGFKALPGSDPLITPAAMTVEEAARFIANEIGGGATAMANIIGSVDTYRTCYRSAAAKLHPDRTGGQTTPAWLKLQAAKDALDRHHG
jgi:hypothetical protein